MRQRVSCVPDYRDSVGTRAMPQLNTCATGIQSIVNLSNIANVPFDNKGYLQARDHCFHQQPFELPSWPPYPSKLYPTRDYTRETRLRPNTGPMPFRDMTVDWPPAPTTAPDYLDGV